jgi:hypothetical protein
VDLIALIPASLALISAIALFIVIRAENKRVAEVRRKRAEKAQKALEEANKAFKQIQQSIKLEGFMQQELPKLFPVLKEMVDCPRCESLGPASGIIPHINDVHKMSREYIADWLETLDRDITLKAESVGH